MLIYRIRRCSGAKNESNYYYHADVIARSSRLALRAAKDGRVCNWRWIDRFDTADRDYLTYEFLYRLNSDEAENPQLPQSVKLSALEKRVRRIPGVRSAVLSRRHASVFLENRRPETQAKACELLVPMFPSEIYFHYLRTANKRGV